VNKLKEKISLLIQLQDNDNKINEITKKKNEGPLRIRKLEDELNFIESKFQEEHDKLESLKKDRRAIEQEIQDLENKAEKSDIKLSGIKSNKEYKAVIKEIDELKKVKFLTEDKAIQIMEEIEELENRSQENKNKQTELRKQFEKDKDGILEEIRNLDEELEILEKKRMNFTDAMDQDLLKRYHFLKERKGGQAISPVVGGVCQTCHMGIPPQKFNESIKGHSLLTCPNCNRIIYWGEDEHFKKARI
jgi:predicted  nucleic acid-binding Zn-ribbon protein